MAAAPASLRRRASPSGRRARSHCRAQRPRRRLRPPQCAEGSCAVRACAACSAAIVLGVTSASGQRALRRGVERIGQAKRQTFGAGPGDHRAVIGASSGGGATSTVRPSKARRLSDVADRLVGGDAAGGDQRGRPAVAARGIAQTGAQPIDDHVDHRLLERRAEVGARPGRCSGAIFSASSRTAVFRPESEKSAFGPPSHRTRQREAFRIALPRPPARPAARPDRRARAASPSCRRLRRWHRRPWCRAARNRRRRARPRSGCGRPRPGTGNKETACRRSAAPSAHALRDD